MINLDKHKVTIDGKDYLPFDIVEKAYKEIYDYNRNQSKLDAALNLLSNSVSDISTVLKSVEVNDKDSTRES